MTRIELTSFVTAAIRAKGGIDRASSSWDIQAGNLKAVSEGRREPGPRLMKMLGLTKRADGEWVVTRIFGSEV